jgi:xylan 1,4-beta-xylosidase
MARSRNLWGPYENAPNNPILTSKDDPDNPLQSSGHGDLFQTPNGDWWTTHLSHRKQPRAHADGTVAILGRETCLQAIEWPEGDWPRLRGGGHNPQLEVPAPDLPAHPWPEPTTTHSFSTGEIPPEMASLREPTDESWCRTDLKEGCLSLKGRRSLFACFDQSLIARRLKHHRASASTTLMLDPQYPKQDAGLIVYYDRINYHYLRVGRSTEGKLRLSTVTARNNHRAQGLEIADLALSEANPECPIGLRMHIDGANLTCAYRIGNEEWIEAEAPLDMTILGDGPSRLGNFTGTFVGLCAQSMTGDELWAHFTEFNLEPC